MIEKKEKGVTHKYRFKKTEVLFRKMKEKDKLIY